MARRCQFKKHAGGKACCCGCLGKKYCKVPLPFTLDSIVPNDKFMARVLSTARKWAKKKALRTLVKVKEQFEGVDDMVAEKVDPVWVPLDFCFIVPDRKGTLYEHQTGGCCCSHPTIKGKLVEIHVTPTESRMINKLFGRLSVTSQFHVPHSRVVRRVISYLKLPVDPKDRRTDQKFSKDILSQIALAEAMGASANASHEAWQWVDVVSGDFKKCPDLEKHKGKRVLMIYPNSD